jgi:methylated-DNA-[protein]-cysteine S-methyltransferase
MSISSAAEAVRSARHVVVASPLGELTLVAADGRLTGLYFRHHWYRPAAGALGAPAGQEPVLDEAARQLAAYFAGRLTSFDLPLDLAGDPFQRQVWARLTAIPYGARVSYGDLAAELGDRSLARDVGAAVGRNPVSIIVPCHRVVGRDGQLTGYAGGLRRKRYLLDLEEQSAGAAPSRLF